MNTKVFIFVAAALMATVSAKMAVESREEVKARRVAAKSLKKVVN